MRLSSSLKCMSLIALLALIYTHMQMQIIEFAYQGHHKKENIINLVEKNGVLSYHILALKSSHHLGQTLLAENSVLQFRDSASVVEVAVAGTQTGQPRMLVFRPSNSSNPILNFFSFGTQAEARSVEYKPFRPWRE